MSEPEKEHEPAGRVNLGVFNTLGNRWYTADDDPIALLRAESRLLAPWVDSTMKARFPEPAHVLDVGCGGGFLSNALAEQGHRVTGVDLSKESLRVAQAYDRTHSVDYKIADATLLPFPDRSFHAVAMMDFLEHVESPERVIAEAARVLRPGGLFFFHTFNRNPLSRIVIIKGVEWFVKNTPPRLHLYRYFIRPRELSHICEKHRLSAGELRGCRPVLGKNFLRLLLTGKVASSFQFIFTKSVLLSYAGWAMKEE